ncbi:hypothetical protein M1146_01155 [Patescibacteria group bacterium]|nr:hypothetical protein [Patescibacteria group bacterium]
MKRLIFFLYALYLIIFTIFSYAFIDPNLTYFHQFFSGFAFNYREITTGAYLISVFIFFIFYIYFVKMTANKYFLKKDLKLLIILTICILFFAYPAMLSYDIFNYISTTKVLFFYHENPYVIMPIDFIGDPNLLFMHAANKIALYGPVWIALTGIPFFLGFGNFVLTLFSYKLFALIFYVLTIMLVEKLTKNILSVAIFALNPLVIIETLIGSHNDIAMMFLVLLSFLFISRRRIFLSAVFLISSILIKYATIFLIPVFLYTSYKSLKNEKINWQKVYFLSFISMFFIFFLSPLKSETYPWYAIWFLIFASMIPERKIILYLSLAFSFSLLLRYVPFMLVGTYNNPIPLNQIILTFFPPFIILFYFYFKNLLWAKKS